jgi:hypothetical protein
MRSQPRAAGAPGSLNGRTPRLGRPCGSVTAQGVAAGRRRRRLRSAPGDRALARPASGTGRGACARRCLLPGLGQHRLEAASAKPFSAQKFARVKVVDS